MASKIRNLCVSSQKSHVQNRLLDNVAALIFYPGHDGEYIQSIHAPEERYGIPVDEKLAEERNGYVPSFERFGPNERYLINKVMFSPSPLLCIVGGVGVGKTRFLLLYEYEVLPEVYPQGVPPCCWMKYDFLGEGARFGSLTSTSSFRQQFLPSFCDLLDSKVAESSFFSVEKEVTVVWDELLRESGPLRQTPAYTYILRELREQDAGADRLQGLDYQSTVSKRRAIRKSLLKDLERRFSYVTMLLGYINRKYFDHPKVRMTVVIDNVDQEPSLVQQELKQIIKSFANLSGVRTIITARRSTYRQHFDDAYARPIDVVAHCGPEPRDIVNARLRVFLASPSTCEDFLDPSSITLLQEGIKELNEHYFNHDLCRSLFDSLCGCSIRKTIVLAQNLICNSIYDPFQVGSNGLRESGVNIGDVLRAILVGTNGAYTWSSSGIIENVFEVQGQPGAAHLIKVRLLRLLAYRGDSGSKLSHVYDNLRAFGYSPSLICDALNELNEQPRKLIWSDTVQRRFDGETDLARLGHSTLSLSTVGRGYHDYLYHSLDYIQEVMLDTTVNDDFGSGWEYSKMEDRFTLVFKFLSYLAGQEKRDMARYLTNSTADEYHGAFGRSPAIVLQMLRSVRGAVDRIMDSIVANHRGRADTGLLDFRTALLADYDGRITEMENLQARFYTGE